MEKTAKAALDQLQIIIPSVRSTVAQLSGGQRQSIAVAKAVLWAPKVVILDEPTAALGVAQQRQVLDLIKRLREAGLAVVVITHNVVDVFAVADVAIVMRLGQAGRETARSGRHARRYRRRHHRRARVRGSGSGSRDAMTVVSDASAPRSPVGPVPPAPTGFKIDRSKLATTVPIYAAIVLIWLFFESQTGGRFIGARNLSELAQEYSYKPLLAIGVVFVLLLGDIDFRSVTLRCCARRPSRSFRRSRISRPPSRSSAESSCARSWAWRRAS